jgi:6,7-dimethyl-8-ribityllumazine synthase
MSSEDPAFYDHEADGPFVTPPVPRPVVPPAPAVPSVPPPVPAAQEPWPGETVAQPPFAPQQPVVPPAEPVAEPVEPEPVAAEITEPPAPPKVAQPPVEAEAPAPAGEHVAGDLQIPEGYRVVAGEPQGGGRAVGIVVSRFNGEITTALLESALEELALRGIGRDAITIMPVPGAFELPIAAMALAKTRRFSCVVALGCVIRGETPHFDYVAGEAASGLQLAALETGVPIAFGVLTVEDEAQARARIGNGASAVRTGLELADSFARLRAAAAAAS